MNSIYTHLQLAAHVDQEIGTAELNQFGKGLQAKKYACNSDWGE